MENVRCKNCGLLGLHNQQVADQPNQPPNEIGLALRDRWRFPAKFGKWSVSPLTLIDNSPVCCAKETELEHEILAARHGSAGHGVDSLEQFLTTILSQDRKCANYISWKQGYSPNEHLRGESDSERETDHSLDFTSVRWYGASYTFSKGNQSESVRVLWEAWKRKTPTISEKTIGLEISSSSDNFQLAKVFRKRRKPRGYETHPAWGTLIQRVGKGTYRLVEPENPAKDQES